MIIMESERAILIFRRWVIVIVAEIPTLVIVDKAVSIVIDSVVGYLLRIAPDKAGEISANAEVMAKAHLLGKQLASGE